MILQVVRSLFPTQGRLLDPIPEVRAPPWDPILSVQPKEFAYAVNKIKGSKVPGPDGIPGKVVVLAMQEMAPVMQDLMTTCLRTGHFPQRWKHANLVLVPKKGQTGISSSAFRLICLLDEMAKLFERIINQRIVQHLTQVGPDLSPDQYGFRRGRFTINAILRVRSRTEEILNNDGVALVISFDITNAFNTLPWCKVGKALHRYGVPPYLINIIRGYFKDRTFSYRNRDEIDCELQIEAGVPQGSVLGPTLWDLAYDEVLRATLSSGALTVGYADDTIVVIGADTWQEATDLANLSAACVVRAISRLGLKIAPHKTQAIFIHYGTRGAPPRTHLEVAGTRVLIETQMKYLGLYLDGNWSRATLNNWPHA